MVAFGVPTPGGDPRELIGDLMLLCAGAAWGATTLVIKASSLARASFEKTLLYQLMVSAPMLALCAHLIGERVVATPSAVAVGSLVYQTVWISAITYLAWFALIRLGEPALGLHLSHAAVRRCGQTPAAGRPADAGLCGGVALVVGGLGWSASHDHRRRDRYDSPCSGAHRSVG